MPKRQQFFEDVRGEDRHAALLVTQVGGMPGELQAIIQIAQLDDEAGGLRPLRSYIVRALGVLDHRVVTLGTTVGDVSLSDDHPLLYEFVTAPTAVFFRGQPDDINATVLDIAQAHASTFGPWRHFPQYLNVEQSLYALLASGGGLLGQMPQPFADEVLKVCQRHGLETHTQVGQPYVKAHANPMGQTEVLALLLGDSYFVAHAFSFEEMGRV